MAKSVSMPKRKLALVIEIDNYEENYGRPKLVNPVRDADSMANTLLEIGFTVTSTKNKKYVPLKRDIDDFVRLLKPLDLVVFFFAGHAVQWEDQNFLLPANNRNLTKENMTKRAINAQLVLEAMMARDSFATIFFLDCCRVYEFRHRDLPDPGRRGPAAGVEDKFMPRGRFKQMPTTFGSLIVYACKEGTTASDNQLEENGLFTKYLLRYIVRSNETIHDILYDVMREVHEVSRGRQQPFYNGSLKEKVYLYTDNEYKGLSSTSSAGTKHVLKGPRTTSADKEGASDDNDDALESFRKRGRSNIFLNKDQLEEEVRNYCKEKGWP
ncbi:unnamed protein product [Didymodactylos carnosus]|uniref:Caspase family p20 domain-containing protein n=1 Tax=Didymodactylos carnosus TaxID=1234261 RepID=A0A814QA16_9BILA|nr:unnamed protein product [Didymodactylos carnosus]CAF3880522.1 unnamed protein product [Didymodactylos carnosus]